MSANKERSRGREFLLSMKEGGKPLSQLPLRPGKASAKERVVDHLGWKKRGRSSIAWTLAIHRGLCSLCRLWSLWLAPHEPAPLAIYNQLIV